MDNKDILKNLDLSKLDNLSPTEKQLVFSMLEEYSKQGKSDLYDKLMLEEYEETPVDILTFVDDNYYLGNAWHDGQGNSKLYPYWRKELKKIFPNNLQTSINNVILSGSRGRGKTELAVLIAAYLLYRILCLKNPIEYFHLKSTEKIVFAFMNIKLALAEEIATTKFQNTIKLSPWFLAHGTLEGRTKKIWVPRKYLNENGEEQEAIDIKIGSQADDLIGLPIYYAFFDEISFIKNQDVEKQKEKAKDMINTAIGGMKTRFVHKGKNPTLLCLASSKRSDKSFLEEHMKKKLESEKENVYISDGSVWEVKPEGTYSSETFKVALGNKFLQSVIIPDEEDETPYIAKGYKIIDVPIDFKPDFIDDIDRALCDFAGISSSNISKYINGEMVNDLLVPGLENPFSNDILEIGDAPDDDRQYYNFFNLGNIDPKLKSKPLYIHMDLSKTGDKTGIVGVFIKGKRTSIDSLNQSKDLYFSIAFSVAIKAPKGRSISFEKNRNFIYWLKKQGFNIKGITTDSFQSVDTGQMLASKGFNYATLSVDKVDTDKICKPYQYLKSVIYEKRLELHKNKLLIRELTDLERNIDSGKVDHPDDGCFTGDTKVRLVDGRSLSFFDLVKEYIEGKTNYVYSINLETKKIEPKQIVKAWKTKENQPLVKLTFDNGETVECTLNHRFMLRDGTYIEAKDMIPGESLMPLDTKQPEKGGLKNYRMYYEPFENKWHYEHRSFAKDILDEKYLVHHKDCNPQNNNPTNLVWCSKAMHHKIHDTMQTGAQSKEAKEKGKASVKEWHNLNKDSDNYFERNNKTRKSLLEYNLNKSGHNKSIDIQTHIDEIEKIFNVKWNELTNNEKNSYGVKLSRLKDKTITERVSKAISENHKKGKYKKAKEALQKSNEQYSFLKKLYPKIDKEVFKELFGFEYSSIDVHKRAPWVNRYRQKLFEVKNHKLVSIEFIDKKADVYDIEVADNHNFALDCGIFVHNSKDTADALCGAIYNASQHAEEFAYDYGETSEEILRINMGESEYDTQQLTVDFQEELKKLGPVLGPPPKFDRVHPSDADTGTNDYSLYNEDVIIY